MTYLSFVSAAEDGINKSDFEKHTSTSLCRNTFSVALSKVVVAVYKVEDFFGRRQ